MSARVQQGLSERPIGKEDVLDALNREIIPALKQARAAINARFGQDGTTVSGDYSVTVLDEYLLVDASAAPVTVTLLDVSSNTRELFVIKIDASPNAVTIAAQTGEAINGVASKTLAAQWDVGRVVAIEGENYMVSGSSGGGGGAVSSVFGRIGAVIAAAHDYKASQIDNDSSVSGTEVSDALNTLSAAIGTLVTGVSSVFGRTGTVTAQTGDYTAAQVGAIATGATAGGDLASTLPNPNVAAIHETGGPTQLVIGTINDGEYLKRSGSSLISGTPSGTGSGTGSTALYVPPSTPGTIDDEFDSTTLNGAWAFYDLTNGAARTPSGAVDAYSALTGSTAVPRTTLHTNGRRSWCRVQATDSASQLAFYKSVSPPTNVFYWTRLRQGILGTAGPASNFFVSMQLWAATSGHPDANNSMYVGYGVSAGSWSFVCDSFNGGVDAGASAGGGAISARWEFFGIHKISTTYYFYIFSEGGQYISMKSDGYTNAFTPAYLGWRMVCGNTHKPYDIYAFDFIRELDVSGTGLPF